MTSKNDLMNKLREQDVLLTVLSNNTGSIACSLSSLKKARNQPDHDTDELEQLQIENEKLTQQNEALIAENLKIAELSRSRMKRIREILQQNEELTAENLKIAELSTKRWEENIDLRAENIDLKKTNQRRFELCGDMYEAIQALAAENTHMHELLAVAEGAYHA